MRPLAIAAACMTLACYCFYVSLTHYLKTPAAIDAAIERMHEGL